MNTSPRDGHVLPQGAAAATLAIAILSSVMGFFAPPVVIGDLLMPAFVTHAAAVLASLVAMVWISVRTRKPRLTGRVTAIFVGVAVVCLHSLYSLATTTFTILEPVGLNGCRVVARESAFLMSSDGSVGAIGRYGGLVWMKGDYSVNDGRTPIRDGEYRLEWGTDGKGTLAISEAYDQDPAALELSCQ